MWGYRLVAPYTFARIDLAEPAGLADGQVLIRFLAAGICGSDLPGFRGTLGKLPGDTGCCAAEMDGFPIHEIAGEVPPLADRCLACFPTALVRVGLRELAACAIGVSFDAYERLASRGEPGVVATEIIEQALDEEMGAS